MIRFIINAASVAVLRMLRQITVILVAVEFIACVMLLIIAIGVITTARH